MIPEHRIKSFVRREGRMTKGQKQALAAHWSRFGLMRASGPIHFKTLFHNENPVILEIGFGMGQSLLTLAEQHPHHNFIGIEVHRPGVGKLLAQLAEQAITNVRIYQEDAVQVLMHCIPDLSFQRIFIYFPDPWLKKRHHKRRIIQRSFVALLVRKLITGGEVYLATDWEDYANYMLMVFQQFAEFKNQTGEQGFIMRPDWRPMTKFEQRGQRLGYLIWDLGFNKN